MHEFSFGRDNNIKEGSVVTFEPVATLYEHFTIHTAANKIIDPPTQPEESKEAKKKKVKHIHWEDMKKGRSSHKTSRKRK